MKAFFIGLGTIIIAGLSCADAQQLLFFRGERIMFRFSPGDPVWYGTRANPKLKYDVLRILQGDMVILVNDTLVVSEITRIAVPEGRDARLWREKGYKVLLGGILLGLGDYITVTAVQDKEYEVHRGVAIVSAGLIAAGTAMILLKPAKRIGHKNRLLIITYDSPLYKSP